MANVQQQNLPLKTWGGKRAGAGRPRVGKGSTPHRARAKVSKHEAVHVTLRVAKDVGNLRAKRAFQIVRAGFAAGRERLGFRLVHFSVQSNHLHLLVEADDADALSRGLKGLQIRLARSLNKLYGRTGRLFGDRYHAHVLKTPREVRHVLEYVLLNARKHFGLQGLDPCSSAHAFDGWKARIVRESEDVPVVAAKSWLLRIGWRKHGLINHSH